MSKEKRYILKVYFHNGEKLETEATQTELDELYVLFLDTEKQDFCTVGNNEFNISDVESFAYKEIENL